MKHEKNIYMALPNSVKLQVSEEAQEMVSKLRKECLAKYTPTDMVTFLINEIFKQYTTFKAQEWFKNKAYLKDMDIIQESYDKEIKDLNEVIQRFHDKK